MYKVIINFTKPMSLDVLTKVYTYPKLEDAIEVASDIKDRISSLGCKILLLRIYKTEKVGFPEMI